MSSYRIVGESPFSKLLFADTRSAVLWLVLRLYVGYVWVQAGWGKFTNTAWIGDGAGTALRGFMQGALSKTEGLHPDVQWWYAEFIQNVVLPHPVVWSKFIVFGELAVGAGLILGAFTGIAAFFGLFMNLNFLLAGTVSVNPVLFVLTIGILLAWRVSGYLGLDRFLLPLLGVPWKEGDIVSKGGV